jgi:hypothetical protein
MASFGGINSNITLAANESIRRNSTNTDFEAFTPAAGSSAGTVPVGGIILWSGTIATIPATWALCDGTSNSPGPDLRDKFIVGAKQDDAGVAKTNIEGSLKVSGGVTGHIHSAHGNLSHAGGSVADHTGFTHSLAIANHPDLTHNAISAHAAQTITHDSHSFPGYTHPVLTIEGMTHPNISVVSVVATMNGLTHPDISVVSKVATIDGLTHAAHATLGVSVSSTGTARTLVTGSAAHASHPTHTGSVPSQAITYASHPTHTGSVPSQAITYASHPTFTSSAPASHAAMTLTHGDHSLASMTHEAAAAHGTSYGVHTITQPDAHGAAGTVTHSFTQPSDHAVSAHDTVLSLPNYYALAFIQRMS